MKSISDGEYTAIVAHIQPILQGYESHVEKLRELLRKQPSDIVRTQLAYYRNYCSACRHLLAIARKKAGVKDDALTRNQRDS